MFSPLRLDPFGDQNSIARSSRGLTGAMCNLSITLSVLWTNFFKVKPNIIFPLLLASMFSDLSLILGILPRMTAGLLSCYTFSNSCQHNTPAIEECVVVLSPRAKPCTLPCCICHLSLQSIFFFLNRTEAWGSP